MNNLLNRLGKQVRRGLRATQTFRSYADALQFCSQSGYENETLVSAVFEKTRNFAIQVDKTRCLSMSSSAAFGLLSIQKSFFEPGKIFILDFGGACGAHYFLARAFFQKECRLFWSVVETRKMCDYGRHLENDELHFFVDIESAIASMPRIDLVHTSGTLQCVDEPERYLGKLVSCAGRHLLFNRTGFTKGRHNVIAIHESLLSENGIGPLPLRFADAKIRYPFTFMRKEIFDAVVNQDYAIVMESNDDTGILAVNDEPIIGGSLFYQLKSLIGQQTVFSGSAASSNVSAKSDLSE